MSSATFTISPIEPADDDAVAAIIRTVMPEFGASGKGFAIHDAEVGAMYAAYRAPRSAYFVLRKDGRVVGGAGVAPLAGACGSICELRKMYFLPEARGQGQGERMLRHCLDEARRLGFETCYLETTSKMVQAHRLYAKLGFTERSSPCGATGHFSCDKWYERPLADIRSAETRDPA
jgi:putative acetyltransferase